MKTHLAPVSTHLLVLLALADLSVAGRPAFAAGCPKPSFSGARIFEASDATWAGAVGDFNGDTFPDIAVANFGSNNVSIFLGYGDGTFRAAVNYGVGSSPVSIAVGDLTGDGKADLVVGNLNSGNLSFLKGRGDGTFDAAVSVTSGGSPNHIAVADLNGDGVPDLAVANTVSTLILLGNGNGTFQAPTSVGGSTSVAAADLDRDGKVDLVGAVGGSAVTPGKLLVMLGTGGGAFANPLEHGAGLNPWWVTVADLNGDGTLDLASADNTTPGGGVYTLLGNGNGTFQTGVKQAMGLNPADVVVADVDMDGDADIAASTDSLPGSVWLFRGNGNGTFQTPANYNRVMGASSIMAADFDRDGRPDVATTHADVAGSANVSVMLSNANGALQNAVDYTVGMVPLSVAAGDFNADGKMDLATANSQSNNVSVLLGTGGGRYGNAANYLSATAPQAVATGDFNRDGKLDLAVANQVGSNVSILTGTGIGSFSSPSQNPVLAGAYAVAVGDLNGDAKLDLVVTSIIGVSVLKGNGDGTFQAAVGYGTRSGIGNLALGDFNRDHKLDVAVANSGSDKISVLLGNGNGTLQTNVDFTAGINSQSVAAADFDGDGKLDLGVASFGCLPCTGTPPPGHVAILRGNGNGTFQAPVAYEAMTRPQFVVAGDLNGDGMMDLAAASTLTSKIDVLLGNGDGTLQPAIGFGVGNGATAITIADLDANGAPDLAVSNFATPSVSVFLSTCEGGSGGTGADLAVTQTDSPDPAAVGADLTYTLNVTNLGPETATDVTLTDTLPGSVTFVSASPGCMRSGVTVTCDLGSIASGGGESVTIVVEPGAAGSITSAAAVSAVETDPVPSNNTAQAMTTVTGESCPDLAGSIVAVTPKCKTKPTGTTCTLKGSILVQNQGTEASTTSVLRFFLSDDAILDDPGDLIVRDVTLKPVKTNKPRTAKLKVKLTTGVLTAGKYILAVLDAGESIDECDEANNGAVFGPLP